MAVACERRVCERWSLPGAAALDVSPAGRNGVGGAVTARQTTKGPRMVTRIKMGKILKALTGKPRFERARSCSFAHPGSAISGADASQFLPVGTWVAQPIPRRGGLPKPLFEPGEEFRVA